MLNEANDFKRKIHAQFITDVMTGYSHLPTKQFLDAYLQLHPKAKMVSRGLPFYNSFVETFGQMAVSDLNKTNLYDLAQMGTEVYLKQGHTLHSKLAIFDDQHTMVMSYNLHPRSGRIEEEMALLTKDRKINADMKRSFDAL